MFASDYGVRADGSTDDLAALQRAFSAASTGSGGYRRVVLGDGTHRITGQLVIPANTTVVGMGARPGNQGGTVISYAGADGQDAVVCGSAGADWSNSHLSGVRILRTATMTSGRGLTVINPTNASSIDDVFVSGFVDGQILIDDATGGGANPGPNFFRISNFFAIGGVVPFEIQGGRQSMLVDCGGIDLGATSTCGFKASGGENEAFICTTTSVKVEGNFNVPGFLSAGLGCQLFVGCTRYNLALNGTVGAFVMDNPGQQNLNYMLLGCTAVGSTKAFDAPGLTATLAGSQSAGRFIPHLLVGGRGMVVPFATGGANFTLHKDIIVAWTDAAGASSSVDTNLYRGAANQLKTDDLLQAVDGIATKTKAGTPVDGDFATTPPVGTMVVDTTANKIWVRTGAATWKGVVVA